MAKRPRADGFAPGNTDDDGGYIVGKNKPPVVTRFKAGDGRKRGRREKGTSNLATDLKEELETMIDVMVGGVRKKVSRQRSVIMRLADNASRGQTSSIDLLLKYLQLLVEPMRAAERERAAKDSQGDMDRLTTAEIAIMEYILSKSCGTPLKGESDSIFEFTQKQYNRHHRRLVREEHLPAEAADSGHGEER